MQTNQSDLSRAPAIQNNHYHQVDSNGSPPNRPNATNRLVEQSSQLGHALHRVPVTEKVFDLCNHIERANPIGISVELRESLAKLLYVNDFEPYNGMSHQHQFICQFALLDCAERHTGELLPEDPLIIPMKAEVKKFNQRTKAIVQRFAEPFPYSQTLQQLSDRLNTRIQRFDN